MPDRLMATGDGRTEVRFFSRKSSEPDFASFWEWWLGARDAVAAAIADGTLPSSVGPISQAVHALHPKLAWELAKGGTSQHAFCISPEGDPELRPIALAWLASAPAPDETWEYHASRQAGPLGVLSFGPIEFDFAEMRASTEVDETHRRVDVALWHPAFARVPAEARQKAMFLFLDNLLGEDEVERWIGQLEEAHDEGVATRDPAALVQVIDQVRALSDEGSWVLAQATDQRGSSGIFTTNASIKRIDYPFANHHVSITIPLNGMPSANESTGMNAAEDDLVATLPEGAVHFGRETWADRRTIHLAAPDAPEFREAVASWARRVGPPGIRIDWKRDPTWTFRANLP